MFDFISPGFEFEHPLWFIILPLPILVYFVVPAYRTKQLAIKVPFFNQLVNALGEAPSQGASQLAPSWWQRVTLIASWILVVCALAKPTVLGEPQVREQIGRDVMVVVDLSGSMAEQDFTSQSGSKLSRLDASKEVLADFAKTREGDRLGLILFGDAAFVQTPFTSDQSVWLELLNQTDVAMAGQSTHLGDAIGLAIKVFEQSYQVFEPSPQAFAQSSQTFAQSNKASQETKLKEKVVIVLTDGNDTGSFVEPIDAAKVAKAKGVRIHVIAMGDPQTVGEVALDMETMNRIAKESGGRAFEALNRDELKQAYQAIGELEPQLYESTTYRPKQTFHHYLMAWVVVMYLAAFSIATLRRWHVSTSEHHSSQDLSYPHQASAPYQQHEASKVEGKSDV